MVLLMAWMPKGFLRRHGTRGNCHLLVTNPDPMRTISRRKSFIRFSPTANLFCCTKNC